MKKVFGTRDALTNAVQDEFARDLFQRDLTWQTLEMEPQHCKSEHSEEIIGKPDFPLNWELRVMLVALTGLLPGLQLGCIAGLIVMSGTAFYGIVAAGGLLGMIAGGLLEADYWL